MENQLLIHRLNRAQGQIDAIKKTLQQGGEKDCLKTLQLLKASQNALKKFAEAYVSQHLDECVQKKRSSEELKQGLQEVIASAFNL